MHASSTVTTNHSHVVLLQDLLHDEAYTSTHLLALRIKVLFTELLGNGMTVLK